jgi:hypothetical protein
MHSMYKVQNKVLSELYNNASQSVIYEGWHDIHMLKTPVLNTISRRVDVYAH